MPPPPPPPRFFMAADILSGRVQLHAYPLPFVAIGVPGTTFGMHAIQMTMGAAELLESQGWRVVNFSDQGRMAFLRRERPPVAPPPAENPGQ